MANISTTITPVDTESTTAEILVLTKKDYDGFKENMDSFFLIVMGCVVFLMQCGFAFLEAGSVRSKNAVNILIKNMLDALIGGVTYWMIGWGAAYGKGDNPFIGGSDYFSYNMDPGDYPSWFFQFVFAATAATIVSGAIAERTQFFAYFVYSIVITGWVYPVVTHWTWHDAGWTKFIYCTGPDECISYRDFAGSGIVHVFGAVCAVVGCYFIGPRHGRFLEDGKPSDMTGHSVPLAALGGFILLFGFLAFNGGSQLTISAPNDGAVVGLAIVNTIIGGCGGGLSVLFINRILFNKKWSYLLSLNGALSGMVSMCGGCDGYQPWAALVVGVLAGVAFFAVRVTMLRYHLDDPLDAVAVHGGGGLVGVLLLPFFIYPDGIFFNGTQSAPWIQLGANIAGVLAIILWAAAHSSLIFGGLKYCNLLRITTDEEFSGVDIAKHGESAYPVNSWKEAQYSRGTQTLPVMEHEYEIKAKLPNEISNYRPGMACNGGVDNIAMNKLE